MSHPNAELAAAIHRAADLLVSRELSDAARSNAIANVAVLNEGLESGRQVGHEERVQAFLSQMVNAAGAPALQPGHSFAGFNSSPYSGVANALRPTHVQYLALERGVHATIVLGDALEGRPGRAHGGATAAVFDDVMGAVQRVIGRSGYTRTLTVSYYAPVPTTEPIEIVANYVGEENGRFTVEATATHNEVTVATSTGVFTEVSIEAFGDSQPR
jgi:acyl-coenzyme A thioesterase PaaI-like protein